jgi:hypothetical protein
MNDANRILHGVVDNLLREGKFTVRDAATEASTAIAKLDGQRKIDLPNIWPIFLAGLEQRAKDYRPLLNEAIADMRDEATDDQHSFSELSDQFYRVIRTPAATDELPGAIRIPPLDMDLEQLTQHIDLVEKKARDGWQKASILRRFVAQHPEWQDQPGLSLGEILQLGRGEAAAG